MEYSRDKPHRLQKPKDVKNDVNTHLVPIARVFKLRVQSSENGSFQQNVAKYTGHDRTSTYICLGELQYLNFTKVPQTLN